MNDLEKTQPQSATELQLSEEQLQNIVGGSGVVKDMTKINELIDEASEHHDIATLKNTLGETETVSLAERKGLYKRALDHLNQSDQTLKQAQSQIDKIKKKLIGK